MIKFVLGRIFAFFVFAFYAAGNDVDTSTLLIFAGVGMIAQYIVQMAIIIVMHISSSWFGKELFNENRAVRTFGPIFTSYMLLIVVIPNVIPFVLADFLE